MRLVRHLFGFTVGIVALGCGSSAVTTTAIVRPELVAVSPTDFLGTFDCEDGNDAEIEMPGKVHSYVATLFDVTPGADGAVPSPGFQLASSPPTECGFPVSFSYVITSHYYIAQIDGYDRAPQTDPYLLEASVGTGGDAGVGAAGDAGVGAGGNAEVDASGVAAYPSPNDIAPTIAGGRFQVDRNGVSVPARWVANCGGYAPSLVDGGTYGYAGGGFVPVSELGDAGGIDNAPVGALTYDQVTTTLHNCGKGLSPVSN